MVVCLAAVMVFDANAETLLVQSVNLSVNLLNQRGSQPFKTWYHIHLTY